MTTTSAELLASLISALEAEVDVSNRKSNINGPGLLEHLYAHPDVRGALELYRRPAPKRPPPEERRNPGLETNETKTRPAKRPPRRSKPGARQRAAPINFEEKKVRLAELLSEFKRRFHHR